jgi:hypothetical protein
MADGTTDGGSKASLTSWATAWLGKQETSTVVLIGILVSGGVAVYKAGTEWIPAHIREINTGYKQIGIEHKEAVKSIIDSHEKQRTDDRMFYQEMLRARASAKGAIEPGT